MTHDNPENQPSVELISANTTQTSQERSQETREDDPNNATIVEGVTPLSDFKSLPLHWLWPGHILRGKLTILEGDPGLGKSLFTLDLASRVTSGQPMPDGSPGIQGNVVLIAPEDAVNDAIKPRVEAAGGDPSRIHLIPYVRRRNPITGSDDISVFTLPVHLPILDEAIKNTRAVLVIIDPLMAVLASSIKGLHDPNSRRALNPLVQLAQQANCSILIVHHHGSFGNPLLYRSRGPVTFIAGQRTGLLVAQHPSDKDIRILATTKNNFSAKASNLIYKVVGNADGIPSIRWLGTNFTPTASLLKGGPYHLQYSFERQALLKILRVSPVPLSPKELASQTGQDHTLVKQMLRRMFKTGEILSPAYGLYSSHDLPLAQTPFSENNTPATPTTLATLTTPVTLSHPDSDQAFTPTTPTTPATLTTLTTLDHPDSNFTLQPTTHEHNTLITPPTPSGSSIPIHEKTSTPPATFETTIENLRNLLRCSYKDHHLHWIFSTNKAGCHICDTWINNDTNLNPTMRTLYDTLAQHPARPGESNPTWLHRIALLL